MGTKTSKNFKVNDKDEFLKLINKDAFHEVKIGVACTLASGEIKRLLQDVKSVKKYKAPFSISGNNIERNIEKSEDIEVYFTVKVLNTFLCFIFYNHVENEEYYYNHSYQECKHILSLIQIDKCTESDRKTFKKFITDLRMVKEKLVPWFSKYSFVIKEVEGKYEFATKVLVSPKPVNKGLEMNDKAANDIDSTYKPRQISEVPTKNVSKVNEPGKRYHTNSNGDIEIQRYFNRVKKFHEYIRLEAVNYKIPIKDYVIQATLSSNDGLLLKKKDLLEQKKNLSNSYPNYKKQYAKLLRDIERITYNIQNENNIIDVLSSGEDIFIEGKAGYGKSTLIQWLTYHSVDSENLEKVPVIINLIKHKENLRLTILNEFAEYHVQKDSIIDRKLIVLLDGLDEFQGDQKILFEEIRNLKKFGDVQVVCSGRQIPKKIKSFKLDFIVYQLVEFGQDDMQSLFHKNFGESLGEKYFSYIRKRQVLDKISTPLFTTILIAYIQNEIQNGRQELGTLEKMIVNKGKLFKEVLLETFIYNYESDKVGIDEEKWREQKDKEVRLISALAHYLSFNTEDTHDLTVDTLQSKLQGSQSSIFHPDVIDKTLIEFEKHSIINISQDRRVTFIKKEFQNFFSALHLIENDQNVMESYLHIQSLPSERSIKYSAHGSIFSYWIGLIPSDFKFQLITPESNWSRVNEEFIQEFKIVMGMLDQKNVPKNSATFSKENVLNLIKRLSDHLNDFYSQIEMIDHNMFENENEMLEYQTITYLEIDAELDQFFAPHIFDIRSLIVMLNLYDLGLSFRDVVSEISPNLLVHKKWCDALFFDLLNFDIDPASVTDEEEVEIIYDFIFHKYSSQLYRGLFEKTPTRIMKLIHAYFEKHLSGLIELFFERNKEISDHTVSKLLFYLKNRPILSNYLQVNTDNINEENFRDLIVLWQSLFDRKNSHLHGRILEFDFSKNPIRKKKFLTEMLKIVVDDKKSTTLKIRAMMNILDHGTSDEFKIILNHHKKIEGYGMYELCMSCFQFFQSIIFNDIPTSQQKFIESLAGKRNFFEDYRRMMFTGSIYET